MRLLQVLQLALLPVEQLVQPVEQRMTAAVGHTLAVLPVHPGRLLPDGHHTHVCH